MLIPELPFIHRSKDWGYFLINEYLYTEKMYWIDPKR